VVRESPRTTERDQWQTSVDRRLRVLLNLSGQSQIGGIGYSPLPVNLVEAAFSQIQKLQQADPSVDLTNLNIQTVTSRPSCRVSRTSIT